MNMPRDEDADWLKALAGKPSTDLPPDARRRTEAIRRALQEGEGVDDRSAPERDAELERLLFRLRRERLLEPRRGWVSRVFSTPLAAAAVLVLGVSLFLLSPLDQGPGVEEGSFRGDLKLQVIEVENIEKATGEIEAILRENAVEPKTDPLGRALEAEVPAERREEVEKRLKSLGVEIPEDGRLKLEIRERPSS